MPTTSISTTTTINMNTRINTKPLPLRRKGQQVRYPMISKQVKCLQASILLW